MVPLKSLWEDQTALIIIFRRWGCLLCRVWAKQISDLYPSLKENNIRLIGIGVDEVGLENFIEGKYFPGGKLIGNSNLIDSYGLYGYLMQLTTKEIENKLRR